MADSGKKLIIRKISGKEETRFLRSWGKLTISDKIDRIVTNRFLALLKMKREVPDSTIRPAITQ